MAMESLSDIVLVVIGVGGNEFSEASEVEDRPVKVIFGLLDVCIRGEVALDGIVFER